jgi:flagellar motility protein MotE (MotC chaperone)
MNRVVRWFLIVVLTLDATAAALFLTGNLTSSWAQPEDAEESSTVEAEEVSLDALRLLGEKLAQRSAELDRRETEIEELARGEEVLRRAGVAISQQDEEPAAEASAQPAVVPAPPTRQGLSGNDAFLRLQRAYENMEPESAAKALAELASRDRDAVVELLIGWKPRTSGAILDALTQTNPGLAADLSYEIWKRGGDLAAGTARNGR